jgi:hypothetical protein
MTAGLPPPQKLYLQLLLGIHLGRPLFAAARFAISGRATERFQAGWIS